MTLPSVEGIFFHFSNYSFEKKVHLCTQIDTIIDLGGKRRKGKRRKRKTPKKNK
jgi:hypothetical protein